MTKHQRTLLIGALSVLTVVRLAVAAALPLADDEAYYWAWSRHLAWGYPDHPPMIAGIIRLTTALAGQTPLGVRLGPIAFSLGTSIVLYFLGRQMFGPTVGFIATLAYQAIPIFALGAVFAGPDAPMAFFWMLTLWFARQAITQGRFRDWCATGVTLGLATMSKLPAILLGVSIMGFLLTSPDQRKWISRYGPYTMVAAAGITLLPVLWWNLYHHWWMLVKARTAQPWITLSGPGLNALTFLGAQFVYYGPFTFPLLLNALWEGLKRVFRRGDPRFAFLAWAAVPLAAVTWIASFSGLSKPHWPAPGYLVAMIPAVALWVSGETRRRWHIGWVVVGANVFLITAFYLALFLPIPSVGARLRGWDQVATQLTPLIEQTPRSPGVFVLTVDYQTASQIAFQLQQRYPITTVYENTAFAVLTDKRMFDNWNAVFVKNLTDPEVPLLQLFRRIEPLPPISVSINGGVARHLSVYRGYGFRGFSASLAHEPKSGIWTNSVWSKRASRRPRLRERVTAATGGSTSGSLGFLP